MGVISENKEIGYLTMSFSANTDQQALEIMADELFRRGYVRSSYIDAVKLREKEFATGLPLGEICAALPHAESQHVEHGVICLGIPEKPIIFSEMGSKNGKVSAELIFMLAIKHKEEHMGILSRLMDLLQDQDSLKRLRRADSSSIDELMSGLSKHGGAK